MRKKIKPGEYDIFKGINDYYWGFYSNVPRPCYRGQIGEVLNKSDSKLCLSIIIDNEYMQDGERSDCNYLENPIDRYASKIVLTTKFYENFCSNKCLDCVFWHEIGHFHTFRYFDSIRDETGSVMDTRKNYILNGEILPEEKAADLFALYYTSKMRMIEYFKLAIKSRRNESITGPFYDVRKEINEIAIRELCLRKRYISEMDDSKESILKELCKVCGVEYNQEKF